MATGLNGGSMKYSIILVALLCLQSCQQQNHGEGQQRADSLTQKENDLMLREANLQRREEDLSVREKMLDSVLRKDSLPFINAGLTGRWQVKMTCTQTDCPGSAIGDIRNEQWELAYAGPVLQARAMADGRLVRVYSGSATANGIELSEERPAAAGQPATRMVVRATQTATGVMEGHREITRDGSCTIVFQLQMTRS